MHHGSNENNSQHEEIHRRDCISSSQLVYIASPYAGDIQSNTQFAIQCCRYAIQQGCTPIAPHLLYPQMLDDSDPEQRAIGLKLGHRLLSVCHEVWVCGGRISSGMAGEIALAENLGIPVRYVGALAEYQSSPTLEDNHAEENVDDERVYGSQHTG